MHIVGPIGFSLDNKLLKRAGLDYHLNTNKIKLYKNFEDCIRCIGIDKFLVITKYGKVQYDKVKYDINSALLFGSETRGLPMEVAKLFDSEKKIYIPMKSGNRSLNLSNSVAIVAYEAWKQVQYIGI